MKSFPLKIMFNLFLGNKLLKIKKGHFKKMYIILGLVNDMDFTLSRKKRRRSTPKRRIRFEQSDDSDQVIQQLL